MTQSQDLIRKGDLFLAKYGPEKFHEEAAALLSNSSIGKSFNLEEISKSFLSSASVVQNFKNLEFSDLPLTIARGESCFIDLYFWRRRPTTIHNHHFTGAFLCLAGNNIDLEFSFEKEFSIGEFHQIGNLKVVSERNIVAGDIAPIDFQDKFIHQNHHQADLCVNLCFRTAEKEKSNLSNFLYSGLRYEEDSRLMTKSHQLRKIIEIMDLQTEELKLNDDEILRFLLLNCKTTSLNPRLLKLINNFENYIFNKFGIQVSSLVDAHHAELDRIEDDYV